MMGPTFVVQNRLQFPLNLDLGLSGNTPKIWSTKRTRIRDFRQRIQNFHSVGNFYRTRTFVIACSKRTKEEDVISTTSEWDRTTDQSSGGINKENSSRPSSSVGNSENYVSHARTVALCVCSAAVFGIGLGFKDGVGKASEFFAGYLLEQSLSVDNLFVFVLIFKYFKVPVTYQSRVLSYGIVGAIVFRLSLILLGTATIQRFAAVNLLLAAILLYSSFKLIGGEEEEDDLSNNFVVKTCRKFIPVTSNYDGNRFITFQDGMWKATPLILTVAVIELSDIAFAVDSIPAVFGITRDPFIVFSSNLFAILGLRSLYTLISESMSQLDYLQLRYWVLWLNFNYTGLIVNYSFAAIYLMPSIAAVLGFIGSKMILDFFGYHVSTEVSLGFVATSLATGVLLSLLKKSH